MLAIWNFFQPSKSVTALTGGQELQPQKEPEESNRIVNNAPRSGTKPRRSARKRRSPAEEGVAAAQRVLAKVIGKADPQKANR